LVGQRIFFINGIPRLKSIQPLFFFVTEFADIEIIVCKDASFDELKVMLNDLRLFYNGSFAYIAIEIGRDECLLHDFRVLNHENVESIRLHVGFFSILK
jgi:hypothetical protein